jgi:5-hydroxyisourate hydrolase
MSTVSTHVLDTALGRPAAGIRVELEREGKVIESGVTDADGRVRDLYGKSVPLAVGTYLLRFLVDEYFSKDGLQHFYPEVIVAFRITEMGAHYHVPLLLSPFGYSTYRGS